MKRDADPAPSEVELVPIDQFKDFVRRVVSVPKKEIDRRLADQRRRQAAKRARRK